MSSQYIGTELDVFAHASNWKAYLRTLIAPHLHGKVLEVGGGIGTTTAAFRSAAQQGWTALEPDQQLALRLRERVARLEPRVHIVAGTLSAIVNEPSFDCVLYIDVLEHIEDDGGELARAAARLAPGGTIVVLSPAHQFLYTPFDAAVGHYRRYDRQQLVRLTPEGTTLVGVQYCDCAGLLLTIGNRILLRSASPTVPQIRTWDRACVPISRLLDPVFRWRVGKSILAVWRRAGH